MLVERIRRRRGEVRICKKMFWKVVRRFLADPRSGIVPIGGQLITKDVDVKSEFMLSKKLVEVFPRTHFSKKSSFFNMYFSD